jgi:hypothetical protein
LRQLGAYFSRLKVLGSNIAPLHAALTAWDGTAFPAAADVELAQVLNASASDVAGLRDQIPVVDSPFEALTWIEKGVRLSRRLSIDSIALRQVAAETYDGLVSARDLVYGAIRAKYERDHDWRELIGPYEEKIEGIKRDILVDRILSEDIVLKFRDSREIYQFFLLDVDMAGCARTSRVKAAISSCQLYVQRCLIGLEQSEDGKVQVNIAGELARKEWEWRKYYRVWSSLAR